MMEKYKNLCCDISGDSGLTALRRDPEYTKSFINEYQDRILYGRDEFHNKHQEFLNGLGLPAETLDKIYSRNALRLVRL